MPDRPPQVLRRPATGEGVAELRDFVVDRCREAGASDAVCFAFKLSVEEACTNIARHGYADGPPGDISVTVLAAGERIEVTLEDDAAPFRPEQVPDPDLTRPWRKRTVGGLGWYLLNEYMDEVEHTTRGERGNRLRLVKRESATEAERGED